MPACRIGLGTRAKIRDIARMEQLPDDLPISAEVLDRLPPSLFSYDQTRENRQTGRAVSGGRAVLRHFYEGWDRST